MVLPKSDPFSMLFGLVLCMITMHVNFVNFVKVHWCLRDWLLHPKLTQNPIRLVLLYNLKAYQCRICTLYVATTICFHQEACHYLIRMIWHPQKLQKSITIISEQYGICRVKYTCILINNFKMFTLSEVMRSSLPLILSSLVEVNL